MRIPNFQDLEVTKFLVQWDLELQRMRKDSLSSTGGNRSLLLFSPDKSVFEVTVTNAGALTVTKVSG
jgi:hypothetical protein